MAHDQQLASTFLSCKALLARLVSRLVPPHDVEDIIQETYVRICRFQPATAVRNSEAYMVTVAGNLARDYVRRARVRAAVEVELAAEHPNAPLAEDFTGDRVDAERDLARFCSSLRELPPQCRRAFVLRKVYGYSQAEIAREMGIAESTVEKHIAHGMRHCHSRRRSEDLTRVPATPNAEPRHRHAGHES